MNPRILTPWFLFLLIVGLPACLGESNEGAEAFLFVQKDDDDDEVCDPQEDDYDPNDPRCQPVGPGGSGVTPPAVCAGSDPTCNRGQNYPTQVQLTTTNSQNVTYSSANNGLQLVSGSAQIVDTDGDGVPDEADECPGPGWRIPCDGDASNDGLYQTLYYDQFNQVTLGADITVDGKIRTADAYFLMDSTGSMGGEQAQLVTDLTSGTFVDPVQCPGAADTGLAGALKCVVDDLWMGLGQFNEVPLAPHGHPYGYSPYHHHLDMTDNLQHMLDAVSTLIPEHNKDHPEAMIQAMYSVVTGQGLGPWVPNRRGCPAGRWGYPCFRPTALPILMLFTDAEMFNGPRVASPVYTNPPFDGTVGLGSRLPPVEQDPATLYTSDVLSAHYLGDLSAKSVTIMSTNVNFGNDFTTWDFGTCKSCDAMGLNCWGDGRDGVIRFDLSSAVPSVFLSGEGSFYPVTKLALVDSGLNMIDCNMGPGAGDWWGRMTMPLAAGTWYVASDSGVAPSSSVNDNRGPFQIRIQTTADDPSWQTADLALDWTTVETELLANAIRVVSVVSPGDDGMVGEPDARALGIATGSVDQFGEPYMQTIAGDGTGLTTALLDAVRALVGDTRRDITIVAEDNPATPTVDESRFVGVITATQCPTVGINNCLGGEGTDTCVGCLADSDLRFEFRVGNDFIVPAATAQVFEFDLVSLADGSVELTRIPMRVMVPPAGSDFGTGFYREIYEGDTVCQMPPERPDWGILTWYGSTPSDTKIEFEFFTANTLVELDTQIPSSIVVDDTMAQTLDVGLFMPTQGQLNWLPFLEVRAKLHSSSDNSVTPILSGWTLQFNCFPFD